MCLARTLQYPHKMFCNVYIRAAQLIIQFKLDSNTHVIFPNTVQLCLLRLFHIVSVSGECEKHVFSMPVLKNQRVSHHHASDVNVVIHWYGQRQNTSCTRSTDTRSVKQVLKTLKSAFMLLQIQKKQQKTLFSTTHHYFCVTDFYITEVLGYKFIVWLETLIVYSSDQNESILTLVL